MSNKELMNWLKNNRSYTHEQIVNMIKNKMSDKFYHFKFWKKNNNKNKLRIKKILNKISKEFYKRKLISYYRCYIKFKYPISGSISFKINRENWYTTLIFDFH